MLSVIYTFCTVQLLHTKRKANIRCSAHANTRECARAHTHTYGAEDTKTHRGTHIHTNAYLFCEHVPDVWLHVDPLSGLHTVDKLVSGLSEQCDVALCVGLTALGEGRVATGLEVLQVTDTTHRLTSERVRAHQHSLPAVCLPGVRLRIYASVAGT